MARILIIDDDPWITKLFSQILKGQGYEVSVASTGKEGLESFLEAEPHLVVTDIIMPHGDGWETILHLRDRVPDVRIIAISGGASDNPDSYLMLAKRIGADRILSKPVSKEKLLATIRELLRSVGEP